MEMSTEIPEESGGLGCTVSGGLISRKDFSEEVTFKLISKMEGTVGVERVF